MGVGDEVLDVSPWLFPTGKFEEIIKISLK